MVSNRLVFAALALACIVAAAGGGYLASRQNVVPVPASAVTATPPSASASEATSDQLVQETEAFVGDTPAKSVPAAQPAPSAPTPAKAAPSVSKRDTARTSNARTVKAEGAAPSRQEAPPSLERPWPASASQLPPSAPAPVSTTDTVDTAVGTEERAVPEPARVFEPPQKTFEELVVSADSVIGLQTENRISSETARIEDKVEARVTRDVKVGDRVAIPAGARALGTVTQVERGGRFKERARLGIRFHTLVLADGMRVPMSTETIYRDGEAPGNSSAAKIGGGAVGGAILGAILGGAKGAAIGATAGAGGGAAVVVAGDRSAATLPAGTPMTVRILTPITVTTEK